MILVSSCLGGIECRYNGSHAASKKIRKLIEEKQAVMACPELLGGFSTPGNQQKSSEALVRMFLMEPRKS